MSYKLRQLGKEELPILTKWMVDEDWHVSVNMLEACYALDPQGWIAAESTDGQLIGSIAGCALDANTAFGGFFIVRKDWRNKGVGKALFERRLEYLGERNFGIDAVENRVNYDRNHGFTVMSFPILAFMGEIDINSLNVPDIQTNNIHEMKRNEDFEKLFAYDSKMHVIPRKEFLQQWTAEDITTTYLSIDEDGNINGYGCIQPMEGGHFGIGPVFADDDDIAQILFVKLLQHVPKGKQVGFDIPANNMLSSSIAEKNGMKLELKLYRMYTKEDIPMELKHVYAFTTMGIALV